MEHRAGKEIRFVKRLAIYLTKGVNIGKRYDGDIDYKVRGLLSETRIATAKVLKNSSGNLFQYATIRRGGCGWWLLLTERFQSNQ